MSKRPRTRTKFDDTNQPNDSTSLTENQDVVSAVLDAHAANEAKEERQRERSTGTYDLTVVAKDIVTNIGKAEDIRKHDVVEAALLLFNEAWEAGLIDLSDHKEFTKGLKSLYKAEIPFDFFSGFFDRDKG